MICSTFTESARTLKSDIEAISYQLSAISYQLSAISYQLSAIGYACQLSASAVDDQRDRERPQSDAREQRSIGQQEVGWAAAAFAPVYQIQISKDPVQGKRDRQPQPRGAELLLGLRADGIKNVGN